MLFFETMSLEIKVQSVYNVHNQIVFISSENKLKTLYKSNGKNI